MSIFDYVQSLEISKNDPGFSALIFSLIRKADTPNASKIKAMWPKLWDEMQARYDAPAGALNDNELVWHERWFAAQQNKET